LAAGQVMRLSLGMPVLLIGAPAQRAAFQVLYDSLTMLSLSFAIVASTSRLSKGQVKEESRKCSEVVPKRVDHEERRRQITDALLPTAAARAAQPPRWARWQPKPRCPAGWPSSIGSPKCVRETPDRAGRERAARARPVFTITEPVQSLPCYGCCACSWDL
jgi:hypothetical protein